jgi:hypothetical protein
VVYRVSFDLILKREAFDLLGQKSAKEGRTVANALRRIVKLGFKLFVSEESPSGAGLDK